MIPNNNSLTNQFTNVYLIQTNYYTIQSGQKKDLSQIFAPLTGTPGPATMYIVKNFNGSGLNKNLNEIFEPYTTGSPQAPATGIKFKGIDLNQIFKSL
jgi:hypothetical protein